MTSRLGLLLAPGAGADRDQATLVAVDDAASAAGVTVVRMDFPYRKAGRKAPDRAPVLLEAVRTAAADLASKCDRMVLGGRSMGGRMCSMAVAGGLGDVGAEVAGLLLISYPLHPPGKPEKRRAEHFPSLSVPCLFVSGTKDTFGTPEQIEAATAAISGPVEHHWFPGKDHALRGVDPALCEVAVSWLGRL